MILKDGVIVCVFCPGPNLSKDKDPKGELLRLFLSDRGGKITDPISTPAVDPERSTEGSIIIR